MNKTICVQCRDYVEFELKEVETETTIKNKKVIYTQIQACCKECGNEVWVEEVDEKNSLAPIVASCKMVGLITPIQIQEGLRKYNIGSRPLSRLLGWSDVTIARFLSGMLPSKSYSDRLFEIFNSPSSFKTILLKHQNKITPVAFKKALGSLNALTTNSDGDSFVFYPWFSESNGFFPYYDYERNKRCKQLCNC